MAKLAALIGSIALLLVLATQLVPHLVNRETPLFGPRRAGPDPQVVGLTRALQDLGIETARITRRRIPQVETGRHVVERWEVAVPRKLSLVECNLSVTRASSALDLTVADAWEHRGDRDLPALTMTLAGAPRTERRVVGALLATGGGSDEAGGLELEERFRITFVKVPPPERGLVAVVIDDFGFAWNETARQFLEFPAPLTFAVLPGLRSSERIAEFARDRDFEVILHMPMEPESYPHADPGTDAIMVDDRPAEIRARLRRALKSVGDVSGVSNHMGSLATADSDVMRIVLSELDERSLFYLDSRTTPRSVACREARRMGMPCVENRLFLDGDRSREAVQSQLEEAMRIAIETHEVLVIGHAYEETIEVLEAALPELEDQGLRLVTVSELMGPNGF